MEDMIDVDSPEQRIAMRKRQLEIGLRMQRVALAALEELEQKVAAGETLGLYAEDANKLLAAGKKLERAATRSKGDDTPVTLKKPN